MVMDLSTLIEPDTIVAIVFSALMVVIGAWIVINKVEEKMTKHLDDKLKPIVYELKPNGGNSLKDTVNKLAAEQAEQKMNADDFFKVVVESLQQKDEAQSAKSAANSSRLDLLESEESVEGHHTQS